MARLRDIIPLLSGTQYKRAQVLVRYDNEQYRDGYDTKTERYVSGYDTKNERYISGYHTKTERYISGYNTKSEQYITGYRQKSVTEIVGDDPYDYNVYTNNKIGCITNRYATAGSLTNQRATNTVCKLLNNKDIEANIAYINILRRCVESREAISWHTNVATQHFGGVVSRSVEEVLKNNGGGADDKIEYRNPVRRVRSLGVYNPNSTGATKVTRQVDDRSRPIYATRQVEDHNRPIYATRQVTDHNRPIYSTRSVTDYNKPIYSTRTVIDYNKPIYKTRRIPVYEERWVEE